MKIFDFGLAKELRNPDKDGNYAMTGYCGSPIYMAPEVINSQPYNEKADMYSFAILLWEMMALQTPYQKSKLSLKSMLKVVVEKNHRPTLDKDWPKELQNIIKIAWHPDPKKRFEFGRLKKKLHDCVMNLGREANQEEFSLDKSTRSFQNFMSKQ